MQFDERMPGETALAFQYFEVYRDSSASDRSLRKLTKVEINGKKRNFKTISRWSSQFQWQKRVQAFDAENTRRAAQQVAAHQQSEIEAFISKDLEIGSAFQKFISERLAEIEQKPNIQELCQLALTYKETRLWMMELIGILQEQNNVMTKRVDYSNAHYPGRSKRTNDQERFSLTEQNSATPVLHSIPSAESLATNNDESDTKLIELLHWESCTAVLEAAIDTLVDIKTGFMARQKEREVSSVRVGETTPSPSEQEAHKHLRKAWIWDLALQQATQDLPEPYIREKPVSEEIKERNEKHIQIEKKIADGLTLADLPPTQVGLCGPSLSDKQRAEYAEREYERMYIALSLNQHTIEELTEGITIAKELEAELHQQIPRNHPEVKAEVKRIKEWLKKNHPSSLYQLCPEPLRHGDESDNA